MPSTPTSKPATDGRAASNGKAPTPIPEEFLPAIVNCKPEEDEHIVSFADRSKTALIAFIAPQVGVRVSPADTIRASIGLLEEFGIEALVNKLRDRNIERAFLLVQSPGGAVDSSYKIARAVREALKEITTFVPHMAASGGTLLAMTGNRIVMGPMSQITPVDSQVIYKGSRVSAASANRFFQRAIRWYEKKTPEEVPYPQKSLTDKLDPYIMEEWNGELLAMSDYLKEILQLSGYAEKDVPRIAEQMITGYPTHGYVINAEKASKIGLNVVPPAQQSEAWKVMRHWLSKYLIEQEMTHCIRYVIPDGAANGRANVSSAPKRKPKAESP